MWLKLRLFKNIAAVPHRYSQGLQWRNFISLNPSTFFDKFWFEAKIYISGKITSFAILFLSRTQAFLNFSITAPISHTRKNLRNLSFSFWNLLK